MRPWQPKKTLAPVAPWTLQGVQEAPAGIMFTGDAVVFDKYLILL
jgi:hypothetical protein